MIDVPTLMRNRAAVKFLMGLGTNPELSSKDQRILRPYIKQGLTSSEARHLLENVIKEWRP